MENFSEAVKEVNKLANGLYNLVRYELVTYSSGMLKERWFVYIHNYNFCEGETYQEALDKMKELMYPTKYNEILFRKFN